MANPMNPMGGMVPPQIPTTIPPYYVVVDGNPVGPNNEFVLIRMAAEGQLTPNSLVWKQGMASWVKASDCRDMDIVWGAIPPPMPSIPKAKEQEQLVATDNTIKNIVNSEIKKLGKNADLNHIDVSQVTNMVGLFKNSSFVGDISRWDVSNVTNMSAMFDHSRFNGDISHWDVWNVRNMENMFRNSKFNGDISEWDVSSVENMAGMFEESIFDGDISKWNVYNVRDMTRMFKKSLFTGDISKWNVVDLEKKDEMFDNAKLSKLPSWYTGEDENAEPALQYYVAVNGEAIGPNDEAGLWDLIQSGQLTPDSMVWKQGMSDWAKASENPEVASIFSRGYTLSASTPQPTTMEKTIIATNETIKEIVKSEIKRLGDNADLNHIDVSQVTDMNHLFDESGFEGDISNWDVSNVTNMEYMFLGSSFNGDISKWDVSSVKSMRGMFNGSAFNGDISNWDVSNVTNMCDMFWGSLFNGDISKWDVSSVENMYCMFAASKFEGDISKWDVSNVTDMEDMFDDSPLKEDDNLPVWYEEEDGE